MTAEQDTLGVPPDYVTEFDSAARPLMALAHQLHGLEYRGRADSPLASFATRAAAQLPERLKQMAYKWGGAFSAAAPEEIGSIRSDEIARWAVSAYPQRLYPAVMIGSSNGAAVHLCAALGVPWLPQTVLVPIRRDMDPDEPQADLEWGKEPAAKLVEHNPDLRVYQMHDPNQDRLMLSKMAYFRLKRRRLGKEYKEFLRRSLRQGGTIILLDSKFSWPGTKVSDGHIYQFGGYGAISPQEYFEGSDRIADYLERNGSKRRTWDPPSANGEWPEAEWGFDPELGDDVERFATENGYSVRRITFDDPVQLSPFVADLYRWWYCRTERAADRLLVECFMFVQPHLAFTTGSVPYWATFNARDSVEHLRSYLETRDEYDEILLTLFSNSIEAAGLAPIESWREILKYARQDGRFVGVDEDRYPNDLASFVRHTTELEKFERAEVPSELLTLDDLDRFRRETSQRYSVQFS